MRRKIYRGLVVLGITGLCVGVFGCGKEAASSVPLEQGEHIMYGSYQGEAIEWRVLDKNGDEVLLLSEYGLDAQPFDTSDESYVLWKDSTIRKWLNDDFYNSAFSEDEKKNIVLSSSKGFEKNNVSIYVESKKPYLYLERETEDKIFLLSFTEMCEYLVKNTERGYYDPDCGYDELLCYPTEYTEQHLHRVLKPDTCGWWLCNPVYDDRGGDDTFTEIEVISAFGQHETDVKDSKSYAVRPAMWVTWKSDMQPVEE
ncbi:MAG: DUF6273 domain-containing protein [Blautia sp.]|uniref:DUF6273 domain-containing protein n=1 Tax=uncultured Eubacterium sp. TaxID=165185 RepID=UPI0025CEA29C|nr:DUF6273 domain-containing protein [uncultured Eubacterium sp.]MCI5858309.1 DUF6273 domain-containing protein [Blautia sp.]